jgi:tRNA modification GTPase
LAATAAAARAGQPAEIVALELRAGAGALSDVLGERVGGDVLDALFARFCIGK